MKNKIWTISLILIGLLWIGTSEVYAQWCGDGSCNGAETCANCPADCTTISCGDGCCNGAETVVTCAADCGSCNCNGGTNGAVGSRCTIVGPVNDGASTGGTCDQEGSCSALCTTGNLNFTNACNPWENCLAATNGPVGFQCSVGALAHGANSAGACDDTGSCSASCNDGTLTWNNNCLPTGGSGCSPSTNGSAGSRCSVGTIAEGTAAAGTCDQIGTCAASCDNGVLTWNNQCSPPVCSSPGWTQRIRGAGQTGTCTNPNQPTCVFSGNLECNVTYGGTCLDPSDAPCTPFSTVTLYSCTCQPPGCPITTQNSISGGGVIATYGPTPFPGFSCGVFCAQNGATACELQDNWSNYSGGPEPGPWINCIAYSGGTVVPGGTSGAADHWAGLCPALSSNTCTGIPANATPCPGDATGLLQNYASTVVDPGGCTYNVMCEYLCDPGFTRSGNTCVAGGPLAYSCTGPVPANATLCPGDDTNLIADTARTMVGSSAANPNGGLGGCSSTAKCEYYCPTGYADDGFNCHVAADCGSTGPTCPNAGGGIFPTCTLEGCTSANYNCSFGYTGTSTTFTCDASGNWAGSCPTCTPLAGCAGVCATLDGGYNPTCSSGTLNPSTFDCPDGCCL